MKVKGESIVRNGYMFHSLEIVQPLKVMVGREEWDKRMQKYFYIFSIIILVVVMVLVLPF